MLNQLSKRCEYGIPREQVYLKKVVRTTDAQKEYNKKNKGRLALYGGGFWMSSAEAERIQKTIKENKIKENKIKEDPVIVIKKSEREQAIIDNLKKVAN